jgi:hypothetical protein
MDTISLIVRASHFGLSHSSNQAICEGFELGVLTCASLIAAGPWLAEAAGLVHDHPEWEIGLELVLTCDGAGCRWGPIAGAGRVPGLVDPRGTFSTQLASTIAAEEIAQEFNAQVERVRAWGITPAYLDYEGDANPVVDANLHQFSERLGIPARMTDWGLTSILRNTPASPLNARDVLGSLSSGVHLWAVSPAHDSPETWALWPDEERARCNQADALAICDPEIRALIEKRGIERIGFRQHVEARVGSEAENE